MSNFVLKLELIIAFIGQINPVPLSATEEMLSVNGDCPDHLYSTIFTLKDSPGILLEALKPFAVRI